MAELASDTFDRADETPMASPWIRAHTGSGGLNSEFNLATNVAVPELSSTDACMYYTGPTWPANQYSQAALTMSGTGAGSGPGIAVRISTSVSKTMYRITVNKVSGGANAIEISRFVNEVFSQTGLSAGNLSLGSTWVDGDVLRVEVSGTGATVTLRVYRNGSQVGSDVTDTDAARLTSGSAGIAYSSTNTSSINNWSGGDLAVASTADAKANAGNLVRPFNMGSGRR